MTSDGFITYAEACNDPNLFGPWFAGPTWSNWRVLDKAIFGEPLDHIEQVIFEQLTGRTTAPTEPADEVWLVIGRRGGKDVKTASIAVYLATIGAERFGWIDRLTRGETAVVQLLAVDRDQAKIAMGYIKGFFEQPMLAGMVNKSQRQSIELTNRLSIEVTTNDQRRVRGRTVVAAIGDEIGHWKAEDSVSPDEDVYHAVKPSMATMPGSMFFGISSPHARKGLLWKKYKQHYSKPGNVLVVQAPTWTMNPTVPHDGDVVRDAYERDPSWADAEFGAQFRSDIEALFSLEVIEAVTDVGVRERPPMPEHQYHGFVDMSGGSSDSSVLCISHKEGDTAILDYISEVRAPFEPLAVVKEFVETLKAYRIGRVFGDAYAGNWIASAFLKEGMPYVVPGRNKTQIYTDVVPLVLSGKCKLLDHQRLTHQLVNLERRTTRGTGREIIDHPSGQHDDVANAAAGALIAMGFADHHVKVEEPEQEIPPGSIGVTAGEAFGVAGHQKRRSLLHD